MTTRAKAGGWLLAAAALIAVIWGVAAVDVGREGPIVAGSPAVTVGGMPEMRGRGGFAEATMAISTMRHNKPIAIEPLEQRELLASAADPVASIGWIGQQVPGWHLDRLYAQQIGVSFTYGPVQGGAEPSVLGSASGAGLMATYYDNDDFTGPSVSRVDRQINFDWGSGSPTLTTAPETFSVRWNGFIQPRYTETYTFTAVVDDGLNLWIDGQLIIDAMNPPELGAATRTGTIALEAGRKYDIRMDYVEHTGLASVKLSWSSASQAMQVVPKSQLFLPQSPYRSAFGTGQTIEAEYFDNGGEGISYHDTDASIIGNALRPLGVDIRKATTGGYFVGATKAGEWLEYTLNVAKSGTYDLQLSTSSYGPGGTLHLEADGKDETGAIILPDTHGWENWTTLTSAGLYLSAGTHVLRLAMDADGPTTIVGHIDWLKLVPSTLTVLPPGEGFGGATAQPPALGDASLPGYDAKAIARWDVVPYQTFDGNFNVGVVAFHMNGIDHVSFSVNGGEWQNVSQMTLNPQTNVTEYFATLRARDFEDGQVEVRAIAVPTRGIPRVLGGVYDPTNAYLGTQWTGEHSILLYANADATLDEQVVELPAGHYTWGMPPFTGSQLDPNRWITFRAAPGVAKEDVVIDSTVYVQPPAPGVPSIQFKKVKLENLTVHGLADSGIFRYATTTEFWLDGVTYVGVGQQTYQQPALPERIGGWFTNSAFSDSRFGQASGFIRNCTFNRIGENVISDGYLVLNTTVDGVDRGLNDWHPSVMSNPISHDNRIYYNVAITNSMGELYAFRQGTLNYWQHKDVAVVACHTTAISSSTFPGYVMMLGGTVENMLVKDSDFTGAFSYRTAAADPIWDFKPNLLVWDHVTWPGATLAWPTNVYIR